MAEDRPSGLSDRGWRVNLGQSPAPTRCSAVLSLFPFCMRQVNRYNQDMAMMLSKTYEAFKAAGAPDDKAREAAEEIAGYESRLTGIEYRLVRVEVMLAIVLAGVASLVVKAFFN